MKRPAVTAENYAATYSYYESRRPNPHVAWFAHRALHAALRPRVHIASETSDELVDLLGNGTRLAIVSNHVSHVDPNLIAAATHKVHALRPVIGNTIIPAKAPLFLNPILRRYIDAVGSIPVFREGEAEVEESARCGASLRLMRLLTNSVIAGSHIAIFPEGTRNKSDPRNLIEWQNGVGHVVSRASREVPVAMLPMAIFYGGNLHDPEDETHYSHASIVIAPPITEGLNRTGPASELARASVKQALDQAIELYE